MSGQNEAINLIAPSLPDPKGLRKQIAVCSYTLNRRPSHSRFQFEFLAVWSSKNFEWASEWFERIFKFGPYYNRMEHNAISAQTWLFKFSDWFSSWFQLIQLIQAVDFEREKALQSSALFRHFKVRKTRFKIWSSTLLNEFSFRLHKAPFKRKGERERVKERVYWSFALFGLHTLDQVLFFWNKTFEKKLIRMSVSGSMIH